MFQLVSTLLGRRLVECPFACAPVGLFHFPGANGRRAPVSTLGAAPRLLCLRQATQQTAAILVPLRAHTQATVCERLIYIIVKDPRNTLSVTLALLPIRIRQANLNVLVIDS